MEENKVTIEKKQKSLSTELYTKTQPLRDFVEVTLGNEATPEELAHVQSELRRLSRLVKAQRTF